MRPTFLTLEEALLIHRVEIERRGGSDGLRDEAMLLSALAMPEATFGGQYLHEDVFEMAGACMFHLVMDHPFVDGNKRTGFRAAFVFLDLNGLSLDMPDDDAYHLVVDVCERRVTKQDVAKAFRRSSRPLQ